MPALLVVRAQVPEADRPAFDRWYETEHLPDALAAFAARAAWRGWSEAEPGLHLAFYEFETAERARAIPASPEMAEMRRLFDEAFPQVARTRDVIDLAQRLP